MSKDDQLVLVVPSRVIFQAGKWHGLKRDNLSYYLDLIRDCHQFKRRGEVEEDESFQQIIPYIIFKFQDKYLIYKYLLKATEQRLVNTYQLGVAGHINPVDKANGEVLEAGMMREWEEEVQFTGNILEKKFIGIINDETFPVEKVHLGLLYQFIGDSPKIEVRETDKMEGQLADLAYIRNCLKDNSRSVWTNIVYHDYLLKL